MYKIQKLNNISSVGLNNLPSDMYEHASELTNPDAILLRSFKMHDMEIPETVKVIARAGAGVNNIPIDKCTEQGIVVFNTPGANANGVKELVLMGLFMSSRKVLAGINWVKGIAGQGEDVPKLVEKEKSKFAGPEIKGKTLAVIGLGAIGVMVANDATALGMNVVGFDPFISVDAAWGLSRSVQKGISLDAAIADADYISLHIPLNDETKDIFNSDKFKIMKDGVRILNFARGELVNTDALKEASESGKLACYVTDFPDDEVAQLETVLPIPHLGASTPESEDNCAIMAVNQVREYIESGNIINSVNYPECVLAQSGKFRITIANKNVPNIIGQVTQVLAENNINIAEMLNKHRNDYAYNIIDTDSEVSEAAVDKLKEIDGVIMVRALV